MTSVASGGTADRIAARTLFKVLRAGSGTAAGWGLHLLDGGIAFTRRPRLTGVCFSHTPSSSYLLKERTTPPPPQGLWAPEERRSGAGLSTNYLVRGGGSRRVPEPVVQEDLTKPSTRAIVEKTARPRWPRHLDPIALSHGSLLLATGTRHREERLSVLSLPCERTLRSCSQP